MKAIRYVLPAMLAMSGLAFGHADVRPYVSDGKIIIGGYDDATGELTPSQHVFGFDFGEIPDQPYFAGDPGFNTPAGALPGGSTLSFNLLTALTYWDGTGEPSFGPPPASESLTIQRGSSQRTITSLSTPQPGLSLGTVSSQGAIHVHLNSFLNGSADGMEPAPGIYLFGMELVSSAGVSKSEPFYIVFNNGMDEAVHDVAIGHVATTMVPEPGSMGLLAAGAVALLGRRRRRA